MRPGRQGLPLPRYNLKTLALLLGLLATACAPSKTGESGKDKPAATPQYTEEQLLRITDQAIAERRTDDAAQLLVRALQENPNSTKARLSLAELYLATGQKVLAGQLFKSLVSTKGLVARALQGWGIAMLKQGEMNLAHEVLKRAIQEDPKMWRTWNALGLYYDSEKNWDDAGKAYGKALEFNPDSEMIHNNRGYSLLIQGDYVGATRKFAQALKLDPKFATARTNLRLALSWMGRYDEAVAGVSSRDLPAALNDVGYIAMLRGDYATAESMLSRALATSPLFIEKAWLNLKYIESVKDAKTPSRSSRKKR